MKKNKNSTSQYDPGNKVLGITHFIGTLWFMICVGYILVVSLRQAGFDWWVIFSLSGHTLVVLFVLISLYLFAIFRSAGKADSYLIEHPFTSTQSYKAFYVSAPFLGSIAACFICFVDECNMIVFFNGMTLGTFGTTFLTWVILDPLIAVIETFTPQSRRQRNERISIQRALRKKKQEQRDLKISQVIEQQKALEKNWHEALQPYAQELSALIVTNEHNFEKSQKKAVKLGVMAWQMGGIACMRCLYEMTMSISQKQNLDEQFKDFVSLWWDGIGSWRNSMLG